MTILPSAFGRGRHRLTAAIAIALAATVVGVKQRSGSTWTHFAWHSVRHDPERVSQGMRAARSAAASLVVASAPDPAAALEIEAEAAANADERIRRQAQILAAWARRSPQKAWAWVRDHVDYHATAGETPALVALLQAIVVRDPTLAISFVNASRTAVSDASDLGQLTDIAVVALITTGHVDLARAAIDEWLQQRQPVDERTLTTTVLALAATQSPAGAADWLAQLPGTERYGRVSAALAADWAEHDATAALEWAQSLPPGSRAAAMRRGFAVWSDHDADAAMQWFLQHEAQPGIDQLIPTFIEKSNLGSTDPAAAIAWANLPQDPALRSASLEIALRQWAGRDAEAAARFLERTTILSADVRTHLASELGLGILIGARPQP